MKLKQFYKYNMVCTVCTVCDVQFNSKKSQTRDTRVRINDDAM